jgi:outer membrane protein OmpA-like peptidoglycan-associated protein
MSAMRERDACAPRNRSILAAMKRCALAAAVAIVVGAGAPAYADRFFLGGFFGPRVFSKDAQLGDVAGVDDSLATTVALGVRLSRPLRPWFIVEAELPIVPASTRQYDTSVFWFEPRAQGLFVLIPHGRVRPYLLGGAGMPVALSQKRGIYSSGVTGEGFGGGGVLLAARGITFRLDARVGVQPGVAHSIEPEVEIDFGLSFPIGKTAAELAKENAPPAPPGDRDGDGIVDDDDKCPDRAEDKDGFQDQDGCPDIDNDGDEVLDIADACPNQPETFNGYEDEDGCPDTVPEDVEAIRGTVEGLLYDPGEIEVRASAKAALDKIAATMVKHPGIKVLATGYTDDREAAPKAPTPDGSTPDVAALSIDLAQKRADAVKAALVARGVQPTHVEVVAKGVEDPVDSNDTGRGRLHNRRVEVKFFVPKRNLE